MSAPSRPAVLDWQCQVLEASCARHFDRPVFERLREEHPSACDYLPINKPYSVARWMASHGEAMTGRVLVCDPDIVFFRSVDLWPRPGQMYADFMRDPLGELDRERLEVLKTVLGGEFDARDVVPAHTGIMVFNGADLQSVASRATELTECLLSHPECLVPNRWQTEMYAWHLALAERRLSIARTQIAMCNDWEARCDDFSAIHYCQPVTVHGKPVWHKGDPGARSGLVAIEPTTVERPADRLLIETVRGLSAS